MTQGQHPLEQLIDHASKLRALAASPGDPLLALQALGSAYIAIAKHHPELTAIAAVMAHKAGMSLLDVCESHQHTKH